MEYKTNGDVWSEGYVDPNPEVCFNDADVVGIGEVFAAGEDPIEGAGRDDLVAGLIRHGHRHARAGRDGDRPGHR